MSTPLFTCPLHTFLPIKAGLNEIDFHGPGQLSDSVPKELTSQLGDDFVLYFSDYLNWVPSYIPKGNVFEKNMGLNHYGYTVFQNEGIAKLTSLLLKIHNLFECAPLNFDLNGLYTKYPDGTEGYEKHFVKKAEFLARVNDLSRVCEYSLKSNSLLIHEGI